MRLSGDNQQAPQGSVLEFFLPDEQATLNLGKALAQALEQVVAPGGKAGGLIFLRGELGAGKTTLSRGILRHFAYQGAVKSPTYTLVEPYELDTVSIYHFDLYRLSDPEEFHYLGFEEYLTSGGICLIEWPEKAVDFLPCCDVDVTINIYNNERKASIKVQTSVGRRVLPLLRQMTKTN